jgi:hypothetical protein
MRLRYIDEQVFRGAVLLAGIILASVVAHHFAGWIGVASVVSVYCVWRAV